MSGLNVVVELTGAVPVEYDASEVEPLVENQTEIPNVWANGRPGDQIVVKTRQKQLGTDVVEQIGEIVAQELDTSVERVKTEYV